MAHLVLAIHCPKCLLPNSRLARRATSASISGLDQKYGMVKTCQEDGNMSAQAPDHPE